MRLIIIAVTVFLLLADNVSGDEEDYALKLEKLQNCKENANFIWKTTNINKENRTLMVANATVILKNDIHQIFEGTVDVIKCADRQKSFTCEPALTYKGDICRHMVEKDRLWTPIVDAIEGFDGKCPIKKGTYTLKNTPVRIKALDDFPDKIGYWKFEVVARSNGLEVFCVNVEIEVRSVKIKKKSP